MADISQITQTPSKPDIPKPLRDEMEDLWVKRPQMEPEQAKALEAYRQYLGQTYNIPQASNPIAEGLHTVGQALMYPGGIVRTGMFNSPANSTGGAGNQLPGITQATQNSVSPQATEDMSQALQGNAAPSSEFYKRMGVGPTASKVAGFATDVATDPIPLLGKAESSAKYLSRPLSEGLEGASKSWYGGGFKDELQTIMREQGKDPQEAVNYLYANRVRGGKGDQLAQIQALLDQGKLTQKNLYDKAAGYNSQYFFDPEQAMGKAKQTLGDLEFQEPGITGNKSDLVDYLQNRIDENPDEIISRNRYLNKRSSQAYGEDVIAPQKQIYRSAAQGRAEEWERAANAATEGTPDAGLGTAIDKANNDISMGMAAKDSIEASTKYYHPWDNVDTALAVGGVGSGIAGALGVHGAMMGPELSMGILGAKKGLQWANGPVGRSTLGIMGSDAADSGLLDAAARAGLYDSTYRPASPWSNLTPQNRSNK